MHSFSIVVPTAFHIGGRDIVKRAEGLIHSGAFAEQELIFSHGTRAQAKDEHFCKTIENAGSLVIQTPLKSKRLALGLLRNRGAQIATGKYLLFWDVDLLPSQDFFENLLRWLDSEQRRFAIVPSLYASAAGTRQFVKRGLFDKNQTISAFYGHRRDLILHLALNTSTVAVTKDYYSSLGGFDERFLDHGLEDLDFLLRLALKDGSLPIPSDLLTDTRHQSPSFSNGFRSILNLLSLPLFLEGIVTLHQWHKRPSGADYYARRSENWRLLEENVRTTLQDGKPKEPSRDWQSLIRDDGTLDSVLAVRTLVRQARCPPLDPSALFDEVPQHYFHSNRWWRRVRRGLQRIFCRRCRDRVVNN